MSNLLKNLIIALGIAVIVWLGYTFIIKTDDVVPEGATTTVAGEGGDLLVDLKGLKSYNVDAKIFNDSSFTSLVDLRVDLGSQPTGRTNPFSRAY